MRTMDARNFGFVFDIIVPPSVSSTFHAVSQYAKCRTTRTRRFLAGSCIGHCNLQAKANIFNMSHNKERRERESEKNCK